MQQIIGVAVCVLLTLFYVGSIRVIGPGDRNDSTVVVKRLFAISIALAASVLAASHFTSGNFWLIDLISSFNPAESLSIADHLKAGIRSGILTMILFNGVLTNPKFLVRARADFFFHNPTRRLLIFRDLIFGPIAEEIVFRGCFNAILSHSGCSTAQVVSISTALFWLAHFHHWSRQPPAVMLACTVHTAVFGLLSFAIWFKFKSIISPIVAHAICNACGAPKAKDWKSHAIGLLIFVSLLLRD